ncbi:MAG: hypothetical protein PVJ67_00775, partial [Candidatus Pacearchaeota archaeon]
DTQINFVDYIIKNHTPQGHISKEVKSGNLYYWSPRSDNNSVAWFGVDSVRAFLDCYGDPSGRISGLGVRAVRRE